MLWTIQALQSMAVRRGNWGSKKSHFNTTEWKVSLKSSEELEGKEKQKAIVSFSLHMMTPQAHCNGKQTSLWVWIWFGGLTKHHNWRNLSPHSLLFQKSPTSWSSRFLAGSWIYCLEIIMHSVPFKKKRYKQMKTTTVLKPHKRQCM